MNTTKTFSEVIMGAIKTAIMEESKIIMEKHKKEMNDEIEDKMREVVAKAGLKMTQYARIQDFGHELVITLHDKESK